MPSSKRNPKAATTKNERSKKTQTPKSKVTKVEAEDENICSPTVRSDKTLDVFNIEYPKKCGKDDWIRGSYYETLFDSMILQIDPSVPRMLVFLDLEGTGWPDADGPSKITEIGLYAVTVESFLRKSIIAQLLSTGKHVQYPKSDPLFSQVNKIPPRCAHSLNLVLNPGKNVRPAVSESSGIFNCDLDTHSKFSEHHALAIKSFFNLISAVDPNFCLVAHNGNTWDFKMLKKTVEEQKNVRFEFQMNTCDSMAAFKQIDKDKLWLSSVPKFFNDALRKSEKSNYALGTLYERIYNKKPPQSHSALADCKTMLECSLFYGVRFLNFLSRNQSKLNL